MILQCDQCQTKFRLDDSKLKPGGVKVRCSKCRHVFLAGAEVKQEESDFDAILSGLGAPVAQQGTETAAPGPVEEPAGFGFEAALQSAAAPAAAAPAAPAAQAAEAAAAAPAADEIADFSGFDFPSEPFESAAQPAAAPGEFSAADFELPASEPELPSEQAGGTDYGEFSFDEEPAQLKEEPAGSAASLDFGEFSFSTETEPEPQPEPGKAPAGELDFGEFEFSDEPPQGAPEPVKNDALDFGEFSFDEEPAVASAQPSAPAQDNTDFQFGEFSFSEEPAVPEAASQVAKQEPEFGEFSFEEEPVLKEPAPASASSAPESPFEFPAAQPAGTTGFTTSDSFDMDQFSFAGSDLTTESAATPAAPAADAHAFPTIGAAPDAAPGSEPAHVAGLTALTSTPLAGAKPEQEPEDFDLGPVPTRVPDDFKLEEDEEEGLPPLSISSRRKGRSLLTASVVAVSVLVIVALSGAGLYLMQSGPAAFEKVGLGFVAHWFGVATPEEGRITAKVQQANYYQNKEAGELFVVTGEALNSFRKARASIHVRVNLYDKNGTVLLQQAAYCGNRLTPEQLTTLPWSKIESVMNNQFGDSLSNLGVQPGKGIGFVVAIPNVPKEAADFGVEVLGSTVAGK